MNTLGSRIARFRKAAGLSQAQLATLCGWRSQSRVGNYEKDLREPTLADIELLAAALKVSVGELSYGQEASNVTPAAPPQRETRQYPVISWVAAGARRESGNCYADGVAEELVGSTENAGPNGYWLQVKGRSMTCSGYPTFPEGCLILVQPEGFELVSGRFYIAQHRDGEATFKQYVYDAGHEYLVPLNPDFETVRMDEHWEVIGRVVDAKITGL